jgi:hypothetical protein
MIFVCCLFLSFPVAPPLTNDVCIPAWQEFMKSAPADVQGVEPAINLMSLHDLVEMMQKESEIDWRHVVLVPLAPGPGQSEMTAGAAPAADPMAQMGGATLGDE